MKTAHRNAAHGKRKYTADPTSLFRVLNRIEPFTQAEQHQLNVPVKLAYERLRTGIGAEGDFHTLAAAINICMIRAETIDPMAEMTAIAGRDAMQRCWLRHVNTGKWGFDGPALQDLPACIDLHEQLLQLSTPLQMSEAMAEAIRRMEGGEVLPVN
jgi:hypothetical protein